MVTLTSQQLLRILHEDTYYAIPHSINAWLNSFKLKHSTKLVAQTLISQVIIRSRNKDRLFTRMSKTLLSELSGVGIRTIPSCIRELLQHGIIVIHDTTSIGTLYEILIDTQCTKFVRPRKSRYASQYGTSETIDRPNLGHPKLNISPGQAKSEYSQLSQIWTETLSINNCDADNVVKKDSRLEKIKQDRAQKTQYDHVSQIGTTSKHIHDVPNRDTEKTEIIQEHTTILSQVGTDAERQNQRDLDAEVKALGFESKEKMLLALTFHRLGKRKLDAETIEQMIRLEEKMMRSIQRKDKQTMEAEQRKGKAKPSQPKTTKQINGVEEDKIRINRKCVPNRDKKTEKSATAQIKLRKSQIKGIMTRMRKMSDRIPLWREIALEIIWAIEKGRIGKEGMTTFHRINAAVKLVRENRWRTPAGYKPMEVGHAILA